MERQAAFQAAIVSHVPCMEPFLSLCFCFGCWLWLTFLVLRSVLLLLLLLLLILLFTLLLVDVVDNEMQLLSCQLVHCMASAQDGLHSLCWTLTLGFL